MRPALACSVRSPRFVPGFSPTAPETPTPGVPLRAPEPTRQAGDRYSRRRVESSALYQVVRDHVETFYQAVEDGFASAPLPQFVRNEFERFLACGVLCRGAALLVCEDCPETKVIALSCKGRGFCPSCLGRRMAQTAANLIDHVLPEEVPLRQWVLTFPFELRARIGFDAKLLSEIAGVVNRVLLDFYARAMRDRVGPIGSSVVATAKRKRRELQSGTVTVVQRTSSDLKLNPHFHIVALDGVFAEQPDGPPRFVQLPHIASLDVAEVLVTIRCRVLGLLAHRGVIASTDGLELLDSDAFERDPVLAQLAAAATTGRPPAGPERRQRVPLHLVRAAGPTITGPLCAVDAGFSLHAATAVDGDDPHGKEALLKYVLRPPLARQRLELLDDGLVRITLKRAFSDGTTAIDLDPLSLLCRLAASVPAPGFNTVRYGGVLAPAARWRPLVIPPPPAVQAHADASANAEADADAGANADADAGADSAPCAMQESPVAPAPDQRRSGWRPWSELLKRSFAVDLHCPRCGSTMKLKSFLTNGKSLHRLLTRLGEPTEVKPKAPARGPPYFASQAARRHFAEPSPQLAIFH